MATSGYSDARVTSWDTLRFNWWQIEQSIPYNYTKIGWKLELIAGSYGRIDSSTSKSWCVNINGSYYEGTNTVGIGNNTTKTLASGETIVYHNPDGSKQFPYSFSQYFGINFNGNIGNVSGSGSDWLDTIPRYSEITSAKDFYDDENPSLTFTNPSKGYFPLRAKIEAGGNTKLIYRDLGYTTATSYEFTDLTEEERNRLRSLVYKDTLSVTITICCMSGETELSYSYLYKTMTLRNHTPTLAPAIYATDDITKELTGDNTGRTLIKYYSDVVASTGVSARKCASIVSHSVTVGNKPLNLNSGLFYGNDVESGTFIFSGTDSRGYTTTDTINLPIVEYVKLTCTAKTDFVFVTSEEIDLTINIEGKYFNNTFGDVHNDIALAYRYRLSGETWPEDGGWLHPITETNTPTFDGNRYSMPVTISGLNYKETIIVQCAVSDKLAYVESIEYPVKALPVFDWGDNDFNFNVPVTMQGEDVRTYGSDRIARAYTQERVEYGADSYIRLFRNGSPIDLYNQNIATFNDNGLITINKDMIALVNIHILSFNNNDNKRSWISLWNYSTDWRYTDSITYGEWTTSDISIVINFTAGTTFGVRTWENTVINHAGPVGSYIEIIEL